MSAVGESRQRSRPLALTLHGWPARIVRWVLFAVLLLAGLLAAGGAALAWRLSKGPLDVAWLARRIEAYANGEDAPTRLHIGEASIAWPGFHAGPGQGIELRLQDVRVVNRSGAPGAELKEGDVVLSLGRLLELQVAPRSIAITGLRMRAMRAEDGAVTLDLGTLTEGDPTSADTTPAPSMAQTMAELRQPAGNDRRHSVPGLEQLTQLRRVQVHDAQVTVVDQSVQGAVTMTVSALDLERRQNGGVRGVADGQLGLGDATAALHLQADLAPEGGTHLQVALAPLQSAALAKANPALASLSAVDAALQGAATVDLGPDLRPRGAALQASTGQGRAAFRGSVVSFNRLLLQASAAWPPGQWRPAAVTLQRLEAVVQAPSGNATTLAVTGDAARQNGQISGRFNVSLDHVLFTDLPALWPAPLGGGVRPWLAQNVTGGTAHDGNFRLVVAGPENDPSKIVLKEASGQLPADDLTVWWLRPVPPIEHGQALMKVIGPDEIDIQVPSGREGAITLANGLVRFTALTAKDQFMALNADLAGPVPDALTLLKHPRLHLFDKRPLNIRNPAGMLAGKIGVTLPLKKDLPFELVKIGAQGRLTGLRLGGMVAGRDLDKGDLQFDVSQDGLKTSGNATVAGIASTIGVDMDFRPGPPSQVLQHATIASRATRPQLVAAGTDPGDVMTAGSVGLAAEYTAHRDGQAQVDAKTDLADAGLALLGWRKAPGQPGDAAASILLKNDKLAGISGIEAHGPGLHVVARADMVGDKPALLHLDALEIGPTRAAGDIRFPVATGGPIQATLSGTVLDLSTQFSDSGGKGSSKASGAKGKGTPWIADIKFDRVLLAHERSLGTVVAHAEYDGQKVAALRADSSGAERVSAVIAPEGNGRRVTLRAADGGLLLRALDVLDSVGGGRLALDAHYDDRYPDPPLSGALDLSDFSIRNAVAIGKLLQAITVYGLIDAMQGNGVQFTRLNMPFTYAGDVLELGESHAFSVSLGITAHGRIDVGRSVLDVRGTVVPAYALNSALGNIPLIGKLFSPEHGGGLVAVDYSVSGALNNPSVTVNPLSALTPGFLRGLFKMF